MGYRELENGAKKGPGWLEEGQFPVEKPQGGGEEEGFPFPGQEDIKGAACDPAQGARPTW